jgi:hypothetical protein
MGLKRGFLLGGAALASLLVFSCGQRCQPTQAPPKPAEVKEERKVFTTLTLRAGVDFLPTLAEKGFKFSYYDGLVTLELPDGEKLKELLNLYGDYLKQKRTIKVASFAVAKLIEEDLKVAGEELKRWEKQYSQYASLLSVQGIKVDLTPFEKLIALKEREVFEAYSSYWDKKFEQLVEGFRFSVAEPRVDATELLKKARHFYGDDIKVGLFQAYLMKRLTAARLEADLYKYKEYGDRD